MDNGPKPVRFTAGECVFSARAMLGQLPDDETAGNLKEKKSERNEPAWVETQVENR